MVQIKGVDSTIRTSKAVLSKGAKLVIKEQIGRASCRERV